MSFLGEAMENFLDHPGPDPVHSIEHGSNNSDQFSSINSSLLISSTMPNISEDIIHLRNLRLSAVIGGDAWFRPNQSQPIIITLQVYIDRTPAGVSDDVNDTFNYGSMCKQVVGAIDGKSFDSIDHVVWSLGRLFHTWPGNMVQLKVLAPKSILRVQGGMKKLCIWRRARETLDRLFESHAWVIEGLKIACIIGVNPHERLQKQIVNINLHIDGETEPAACRRQMGTSHGIWAVAVRQICEVSEVSKQADIYFLLLLILCLHFQIVEASSCKTVEALAKLIAEMALKEFPIPRIGVNVEKPSALAHVEGAGVEIWRDQDWLKTLKAK